MSETSKRYYVDTNIMMYAAGKESIYKEVCLKVLDNITSYEYEYYINTEVFQEILYRYDNIGMKSFGIELAESVLELFNNILSIEEKDIYLSVSMMKKYKQLLSRDAIITANMLNNNIKEIISVDKDFDKVSEINRINPEELIY